MTRTKKPAEKNEKFEEYMKWAKETDDALVHGLKLIGHVHDMESWKKISEYLKDKRVCIDNGRVFVATLEDIDKNNYQLIEDVPISKWGIDIEHPELRKHRKGIIDSLKILSTFNLSKDRDGLTADPFKQKIYNDLYKHDDY